MPAFVSPQMLSPTLIGRAAGMLSDIAAASPGSYPTYALTTRFKVEVQGDQLSDLGHWSSCKGLKVEFKYKQVQRGGDYTASVYLPERMEYDKIVLERAIQPHDSGLVQQWLQTVTNTWMTPADKTDRPAGYTVKITLLDPTKGAPPTPGATTSAAGAGNSPPEVAHWVLRDVCPVSWAGPSMSASGSDAVALETLVLQHGGFVWT
ncbi:MAG TPA: phage tail protein [Pseudonocardiaceae bacterium]|nr:phage tail protein [Pseudonocardiaceae bacterium]